MAFQGGVARFPKGMSMNMKPFDGMETMLAGMVAETGEWKRAAGGSITEVAAGWIAPHYLVAVRGRLAALPEGPERFALLRLAVGDAVALQRGGHYAARLQLEREWLEFDQQKYRDARAAAQQESQKRRDPKLPLSDEDRQAIVDKADEILGLK